MVGRLVGILLEAIAMGMMMVAITAPVQLYQCRCRPGGCRGCSIAATKVHGQGDPTRQAGECQQQAASRHGEIRSIVNISHSAIAAAVIIGAVV
jgi:hypothetical protein